MHKYLLPLRIKDKMEYKSQKTDQIRAINSQHLTASNFVFAFIKV